MATIRKPHMIPLWSELGARSRGYMARMNEENKSQCPFEDGTWYAVFWRDGWDAANEIRRFV